jgi:hypothetical protein
MKIYSGRAAAHVRFYCILLAAGFLFCCTGRRSGEVRRPIHGSISVRALDGRVVRAACGFRTEHTHTLFAATLFVVVFSVQPGIKIVKRQDGSWER